MSTELVVIADLIQSKEMAAEPGGITQVESYRDKMREELKASIRQSPHGNQLTIHEKDPQGDNVELHVGGGELHNLADAVLGALKSVLQQSEIGWLFRYTVFSIDPDVSYNPRFSAYSALAKREGQEYHLAIEQGIVSLIRATDWYRDQRGQTVVIEFIGESSTGAKVTLFCKVREHIPARSRCQWLCRAICFVVALCIVTALVAWGGYRMGRPGTTTADAPPESTRPERHPGQASERSGPGGNSATPNQTEPTPSRPDAVAAGPMLTINSPGDGLTVDFTTGQGGQGGRVEVRGQCRGLSDGVVIKLEVAPLVDPKNPKETFGQYPQADEPMPDKDGKWAGFIQVGNTTYPPTPGQRFTVTATMKGPSGHRPLSVSRTFVLGNNQSRKED